ncbi:MAG: NapC/NirT family cytochrome c [Pseudomonadota bacterium]
MPHAGPWLGYLALASAIIAAAILLHFLLRRPPLDLRTKLMLLLGLGVFPTITAATSTVAGMERTTHREFCGSCHTMDDHFGNATDPTAQSLAARHTRIPFFGDESCYVCHADYGMFGYALTKMGGMKHVYYYYLGGYRQMTKEETRREVHIAKPYDNTNCRQCHSATAQVWTSIPDHQAMAAQLASNRVSCASPGCHGYAHPFSKGLDGLGAIPSASAHSAAGHAP